MTRFSNPDRRAGFAPRGPLAAAAALLLALSLMAGGCKKGGGSGGFGSDPTANGNSNNSNQTASNTNGNSNDIKGKADEQGKATKIDRGNFTVQYSTVEDPRYQQINEKFRQDRLLENIADELNASIAIPESVVITFKECGQPNAFWDPQTRSINMCYELMDQMREDFKEIAKSEQDLNDKVGGALTFAFIHELGHCLIDVLNLPSTGREEDAVDQLSTFVLVGLNGEEGEKMALSGALSWGIQYDRLAKSGKTAGELNMLWADEHSMDGQRFYNILCWIFGHNPEKYMGLVNQPLPEQRAVRCPQEYSKLATAWLTLLKPYLKDGGAKAEAHTGPMPGSMGGGGGGSQGGGDGGHGGH